MTAKVNDFEVPYTNSLPHEPSFFRKKKQEDHQLKRTQTTNTLVQDELPKNKALLYKAGYRRVQFDMPTEYRLQYTWPTDPSPLMKAATMTTGSDKEKKGKDRERPSSRKTVTEGTRKSKHVINGAPVNGRTHTIITEQSPNGDKPVTASDKPHLDKQQVLNMQETFEQRMGYTKENCAPNSVHATKKKQHDVQPAPHAHPGGSRKSRAPITQKTITTKDGKQRSRPAGKNKENKDKKRVAPNVDQGVVHNPVPSHPLVSEYQSTFREFSEDEKKVLKKQLKKSNPGMGFKDHVKDIIYFTPPSHTPVKAPSPPPLDLPSTVNEQSSTPLTKLKPTTVITPHTYTSSWTTEYSSSFLSPLCRNYVNGVWQGTRASDDPPGNHAPVDSVKSDSLNTVSWFHQVLELRKKVKEYKHRGDEGSEPSLQVFDQKDQQSSRQRMPTATPTLSVSTLEGTSSSDGSISPPTPLVTDIETSSCSGYQHHPAIDPTHTVCTCHKESSVSDSGEDSTHNYPIPDDTSKPKLQPSNRLLPTYPIAPPTKPVPPKPAVLIYSKPKHRPPVKQRPSTVHVKPSLPQITAPLVSPCSRGMSPPVWSHPLPPRATPDRDDTCQTCGAVTPNWRDEEPYLHNDCDICHYHSNPLSSKPPPNPYSRMSVPLCPPSCPDSPGGVYKDNSFSLSPVSLPSSCSVASEILERAKKRQKNAWK